MKSLKNVLFRIILFLFVTEEKVKARLFMAKFGESAADEGSIQYEPGIHTMKVLSVEGVFQPEKLADGKENISKSTGKRPAHKLVVKLGSEEDGQMFTKNFYLTPDSVEYAMTDIRHVFNKVIGATNEEGNKEIDKLEVYVDPTEVDDKGKVVGEAGIEKSIKALGETLSKKAKGKEIKILLYQKVSDNNKTYMDVPYRPFAERKVLKEGEKVRLKYDPTKNEKPSDRPKATGSQKPNTEAEGAASNFSWNAES